MEGFDRLELKARNFDYVDGIIRGIFHQQNHWCSHVPADQGSLTASGYYLSAKRGCGGLTVGAGDSNDLAPQKSRCKFDMPDHAYPLSASTRKLWDIAGHARAHPDEILIAK